MVSVRFIRTLGCHVYIQVGGVAEKSSVKNEAARDLLSDRELKGRLFEPEKKL